jgi:hypothetical protein
VVPRLREQPETVSRPPSVHGHKLDLPLPQRHVQGLLHVASVTASGPLQCSKALAGEHYKKSYPAPEAPCSNLLLSLPTAVHAPHILDRVPSFTFSHLLQWPRRRRYQGSPRRTRLTPSVSEAANTLRFPKTDTKLECKFYSAQPLTRPFQYRPARKDARKYAICPSFWSTYSLLPNPTYSPSTPTFVRCAPT